VPPTYTGLLVEGPDLECESILPESPPPEWAMKPGITCELGDKLLREKASVVFKVLSAFFAANLQLRVQLTASRREPVHDCANLQ
jgi:hypothetical protein